MITNQQYNAKSSMTQVGNSSQLYFATEMSRKLTVKFTGKVLNPLLYRDTMLCLRNIVISDFNLQIADRSAYFEWYQRELDKLVKEELELKYKITDELTNSLDKLQQRREVLYQEISLEWPEYPVYEKKFWKFIKDKDPDLWWVLDPVITVHPDVIMFEAFSNDESTYGCLSYDHSNFQPYDEMQYGTTNIDFTKELADTFAKVRTYHPLDLSIAPVGFEVDTGQTTPHLEKKVDIPETWIKGFLQVSSSRNLPATSITISPSNMYDLCGFIRRNKAKKSPRAMRFELVPGERVKIVFEPWNHEFLLDSVFNGTQERIVRTWGRRRLLLLETLIPYSNKFEVKLLGSGLPSFYTAFFDNATFTVGFSGWTSNNWSSGALLSAFSGISGSEKDDEIVDYLRESLVCGMDELLENFDNEQLILSTLQYLYRNGMAIFDSTSDLIRYRELSATPLPSELTDLSRIEKESMKLMEKCEITSHEYDSTDFTEKVLTEVKNKPVSISLRDGILTDASCTCSSFDSIKTGPCKHILASMMKFRRSEYE